MCHSSVIEWAAAALTADRVAGAEVLEVGSYDFNGTVRPAIEALHPASYLGADISPGPGVDLVADATDLPALFPDGFDLVVTTEMLEHVTDWRATMEALALLVKPGGMLALSTRSPGFPYHPYPVDNWRYPVESMRTILEALGLVVTVCIPDPEAPGVFAIAEKSEAWSPIEGALESITILGP